MDTVKPAKTTPINDAQADFGTYHHSTPEESKALRTEAEEVFSRILLSLFPTDGHLRVLDAGCGLGFLMYVAAKCFPNASITGVDLFKHGSISDLSMQKAAKNMRTLGISSRTSFLKHDLTKPLTSDVKYDLVVSNVVFHNMGKKRLNAYDNIFNALRPAGYFVLGDLFPINKDDNEYLCARSTLIQELDEGRAGPWAYRIKVLRKNG
jgi:cyclopropane fatty-acyl-phospholipid synthase-like methyltransferase